MDKPWWASLAGTILSVVQSIAIIVTLYLSYQAFQVSVGTVKLQSASVSADTMLKFATLIDTGHDGQMMAVDSCR
jgi:hypothetical protein